MKTEAEIKILLEKYFEAQTTLAEEIELREFFDAVPCEHDKNMEASRRIFISLAEEASQLPAELPGFHYSTPPKTRILNWSFAAAASVILICSAIVFTINDKKIDSCAFVDGRKITDPDAVMQQYAKVAAKIRFPDLLSAQQSVISSKTDHILSKLDAISKSDKIFSKLAFISENQK